MKNNVLCVIDLLLYCCAVLYGTVSIFQYIVVCVIRLSYIYEKFIWWKNDIFNYIFVLKQMFSCNIMQVLWIYKCWIMLRGQFLMIIGSACCRLYFNLTLRYMSILIWMTECMVFVYPNSDWNFDAQEFNLVKGYGDEQNRN